MSLRLMLEENEVMLLTVGVVEEGEEGEGGGGREGESAVFDEISSGVF